MKNRHFRVLTTAEAVAYKRAKPLKRLLKTYESRQFTALPCYPARRREGGVWSCQYCRSSSHHQASFSFSVPEVRQHTPQLTDLSSSYALPVKPSPRIWRKLAWSAMILSVLFAATWIVSNWTVLAMLVSGKTMIVIASGCLIYDSVGLWDELIWPGFTANRDELREVSGFGGFIPARFVGPQSLLISIPIWIPLLLSLFVAIIARHFYLRLARATRIGLCAICGYNRAEVDSASPCPECGG